MSVRLYLIDGTCIHFPPSKKRPKIFDYATKEFMAMLNDPNGFFIVPSKEEDILVLSRNVLKIVVTK